MGYLVAANSGGVVEQVTTAIGNGLTAANDFVTSAPVVNGLGGFGDALLLGQGGRIRSYTGLGDGAVDTHSMEYDVGHATGEVALVLTGAGAGVKAAGTAAKGIEFSHSLPARYFRELSLSKKSLNPEYKPVLDKLFGKFKDTILNGNYRTAAEHAMEDPMRYQFMRKAWKEINPPNSGIYQFLSRIPNLFKGTAAGTAAAGISEMNKEKHD